MKNAVLFILFSVVFCCCSCKSVNNVTRIHPESLQEEGTIIFTRAAQLTPLFGTHSIRQLVAVTYEKASRNPAGQLVVEFGLRYQGPVNWTNWHLRAPKTLSLRVRGTFYENGLNSPMVYSTNSQLVTIRLGETYPCRIVCPQTLAGSYQIVLGD